MATPLSDPHSRRTRPPPKFYGFHTFAEPGVPVSLSGAFRDNIRQFLQQCAAPEEYDFEGMPIWRTCLVYESRGAVLPLFTVEENVGQSDHPFCDYCRCAGWSHHFVSKRKYHLIIPATDEWNDPLDEGAFELQSHLLHGLIHCNGFGHLICINGIEGGSKFIYGREIMDLWDRICAALRVRQITVEDLSKKHMMDLRLLYGVAYDHSWFGKWGYRFCHGSFGVKEHNYEGAIDVLSSLELDQVIADFSCTNVSSDVKQMIQHYRDMSDTNLVTLRDLFRFMLTLRSTAPSAGYSAQTRSWPGKKLAFSTPIRRCSLKFPAGRCSLKVPAGLSRRPTLFRKEKPTRCRKFSNLAANLDSRWPVRRLEQVAEVIVEALIEKRAIKNEGSCGMTRQEARDAARQHIGDTGLIDHVLKVLNNVIIGNYIVCRAVNRSTKVLEYTIRESNGGGKEDSVCKVQGPFLALTTCPERSVYNDVAYLYKHVLLGYPDSETVELAVQLILQSKHFVKDWPFRDEDDDLLRFMCRLTMSSIDSNTDVAYNLPPSECVVVPLYATIGDLKIAAEMAMRDTYCVMERLTVTDILELEGYQDEEVLCGIIESGKEIRVRAYALELESDLRYEGGNESWTVRCKCGARDDDGERMMACDVCGIWQHTYCCGIDESQAVPRLFVCDTCCGSLAPAEKGYALMYDCDYRPYEDPFVLMHEPAIA